MDTLSTLTRLLFAPGVSGYETTGGISRTISDIAKNIPNISVQTDSVGNVLCSKGSGSKTLLIEAHCDEVGFIVSQIIDSRSAYILPIGGIAMDKVIGARVIAMHNTTHVGVGTIEKNTTIRLEEDATLTPGDWLYFERKQIRENDLISSPALDNRTSCTALLQLLTAVTVPEDWTLSCLFATQHEHGSTVSIQDWLRTLHPEFVVICDSAYARPDGDHAWAIPELGKGTALQRLGYDFIVNNDLFAHAETLAQKKSIPYQYEIPERHEGGTDANKISHSTPFVVVNTPVHNQHTALSVASLNDIESTTRLLLALTENIEKMYKNKH